MPARGVIVRVMDADADVVRNGQQGVVRMGVAKKLEGNPEHPISRGGLCARGQASIQITFHPDRIRHPLKRSGSRGDGRFEEVTWDQALAELLSHLDALESSGDQKSLAFVTHRPRGRRDGLIEQFLSRFGAPAPIAFDLFDEEVLRRANGLSFGREQMPTFDLAHTRYVLGFGADFLGTWNSPVAQATAYGEMRQGRPGIRGRFVQVEARMTQTGANADEWVPAVPGTEGVLALGLAHLMLKEKPRAADVGRPGAVVQGWSGGLTEFSPDRVERITGVPARQVERLAREFATTTPAVAIVGGPPLAHTNALFTAVAVNALNGLVGAVEQPGGVFFAPQISRQSAAASPPIGRLAADILAADRSPVQVLLLDGANPVFTTPPAWKVREAFDRIPFIASFGHFLDETSILSDLILPDHSFLESWIDSIPESGAMVAVVNAAPPAMRPLHQTRSTPDVLLETGRRLRRPLELPWQTFEEMLQASFATLPAVLGDQGSEDAWTSAQTRGGWWGDLPKSAPSPAGRTERPTRSVGFVEPQFEGDAELYPFHFLPYPSTAFLDGSLAHLPWLQELPDPMTSAMWSSWIEINPKTAARLGISERDIVEVISPRGAMRAAAIISPGIAPDIVAMPVGQGHATFTRFASGRGENPITILAPVAEPETGALAWAATRVRISRVGGPDGRLILFAGESREHPDEGETR